MSSAHLSYILPETLGEEAEVIATAKPQLYHRENSKRDEELKITEGTKAEEEAWVDFY